MRAKGLSQKEVLAKLKRAAKKDLKYESGKILSSMCTTPHPIAKVAHKMFLDSNLGDPGLFPGSAQLEEEAVKDIAELLNAPEEATGFIVSGGTEANLLAIHAARNASKAEKPGIVLPESAHFSFDKICDMLKVKMVKAKLDAVYRVDPADVKAKVTKNTIAIVGSAGSSELGVVDPISELSRIAQDHNVPLHVDAAFGGLMLPFLKELGYSTPDFDFKLGGVHSITVDPHKRGMSTIPAGGIIFRNSKNLACIETETPYLTEQSQYTFVGTRSGASAAAAWAVFQRLGREGFKKSVKKCIDTTFFFCSELKKSGFTVVVQPTMNIVGFRAKDSKVAAAKLLEQGWQVSYVPRLDLVRVVLMPHVVARDITAFLQDLNRIQKA